MNNLFNYNGTIRRKQYFIKQAILLVSLTVYLYVYALLTLWLIPNDPDNIMVTVIVISLLLLTLIVGIVYFVVTLFLVIKRARDTGSFVLWVTVAILIPFGNIIVGLIPPATKQQ